MGSSVAAVNFPPELLNASFKKLGLADFVSFNSGIRGCNYECIWPAVEKLYLSSLLPKYAVLVVAPVDLDASNVFVIERSREAVDVLSRLPYVHYFMTFMSSISWIYGFDDAIRNLLTNREWNFLNASVTVRGHVDMGSLPFRRYKDSVKLLEDEPQYQALKNLVNELVNLDINVIVVPAVGDSESRQKLLGSSNLAVLRSMLKT